MGVKVCVDVYARKCEYRGMDQPKNKLWERRLRARRSTARRWQKVTGRREIDPSTLYVLAAYTLNHGLRVVTRWMEKACARTRPQVSDEALGRYISGIRRSELEEQKP